MKKVYLEFNDDKSSKFWQIEVGDSRHTVTYGKRGTNGSAKIKAFGLLEEAEQDAEKLIKSKKKKGYMETSAANSGLNADQEKFKKLFEPLCSSDEDNSVLVKLAENLISFNDEIITFRDPADKDYEPELECQPGKSVVYDKGTPRSFSEIMEVTMNCCWDAGGPHAGVEINDAGRSEACDMDLLCEEASDDPDNELLQQIDECGALAAFSAGQNEILFDPVGKLENGEAGLIFVSHGGGWEQVESVTHLNYKQVFLRLLSDNMVGTNYIPEIYF